MTLFPQVIFAATAAILCYNDAMTGMEQVNEDWERVKLRFEAWWQGEIYDRPLISVTAPRYPEPARLRPPSEAEVRAQWTDVNVMINRQEEIIRRTYFGGDALPIFWHNWSAGHSLYFGCQPHFAEDTVWVDPAPLGPHGYPEFENWEASPWWQWMLDSTIAASQASRGRWFVLPMWGNHAGDNLALIRGTTQLLLDIATDREWVRRAIRTLSELQDAAFERLWPLVDPVLTGVEGSIDYVSCWAPGRTMAFDCDFSCMVSPRDFRELFLPPLLKTMQMVDRRIYHLDGTVALQHLDTLLGLPELHAIQWLPGAGREEITQWFPLIKKVQAAGKNIAVYVQPEEIALLQAECRPERLFINTTCATEAAARQVVSQVAAWG